jgi:hypothetical protein
MLVTFLHLPSANLSAGVMARKSSALPCRTLHLCTLVVGPQDGAADAIGVDTRNAECKCKEVSIAVYVIILPISATLPIPGALIAST